MPKSIVATQPASTDDELKKHVGAIHVRNTLTLLQHKIANVLLLLAYDDLLTKEEHVIKVSRLAKLAGFDSNDHQLLREALVVLAETSLQWNILKDGKVEWGVSTMLAQAVIKGTECHYAYSPELRRKLYNPEIYARINLAIQRTFTSGYALKLYENCIRYRDVRSTGWWPLEIFRLLMGLADEYDNFKDLNKCVIKPAIAQVNATSDILLNVEYKRKERKIVELRFHLEENPQLFLRFSSKDRLLAATNADLPVVETTEVVAVDNKVIDQLQRFGLTAKEAAMVLKDYGESYIVDNLKIVEESYLAGKVVCLPAFTKSALKQDYRTKGSVQIERQQQNQRAVDKLLSQESQRSLEELRIQFDKERLQSALHKLSADERVSLELEFTNGCRSQPLFRKWISKGLDHPIMQGLFRNFVVSKLLVAPSDNEFTAYARAHGFEL